MLQRIRDRITGWVAGLVLVVIGSAFVFWGIDFSFSGPTYAAKVNGEEIPLNRFRQEFQAQLTQYERYYQNELPEAQRDRIRQLVLERFIRNQLFEQRVADGGYRVGGDAVQQHIRQIPQFQVGGQFSRDSYFALLAGQGISPAAFEDERRRYLEISQLESAVTQTAFVTGSEVRRHSELEDEQRELSHVLVPASNYSTDVAVDETEILAHYQANQASYMTEETVVLQYVEVRAEQVAADMPVNEAELRLYFEQEKAAGRFALSEERKARHILIQVPDELAEAAARAEAEALAERIEAGEDFAALAREYSDDAVSAAQGGELEWSERDALVEAFAAALFDMETDEVRGPIRSEFGYHVIRLDGVRGTPPSFEAVRADLESEYRLRQSEEDFYDTSQRLADDAFTNPHELASVAEALQLDLQEIPRFTRAGGGPLGANPTVIEAAFSIAVLEEGENSPLLELAPDHAMVLRVAEHSPPQQQPLEDVREEIGELKRREKARQRAREVGEELRARLAGSDDAAALASEAGAEYHEPVLVGRAEASLPTDLLSAAFRVPKPAPGTPVARGLELASGDYAVFVVHSVRPGGGEGLSVETRLDRERKIAAREGEGDLAAYMGTLRQHARVVINPDYAEESDGNLPR